MDTFRAFVGTASNPVRNEAEKGAIKKFADAIGDPNPLYRNEVHARQSRYGRLVAPPTFSRTFDYGEISELDFNKEGLIHGEQAFEYFHPILEGDVLYCSTKLVNVHEKQGKLGNMVFLVYEQVAVNETGEMIIRATSTAIYRG